ncbi:MULTISPECIES: hypothetical protein [unclassified Rhizobium]|uniref:hypothetical protein n=1 Tax=unclassified Rhizobium TaxID=2613769 RepID=UPI0011C45A37|nr:MULTISPECIES: hypothetical protein [unclassified Rhizobium]MBN8952758.1 hypothetical protein [Rhizobium tropici]
MRYVVRLLFFISTMLLVSQPARSEEGDFSGQWDQTHSDIGPCGKCRVGIVRHGRFMTISANNGWSATAETSRNGNVNYAVGAGRWSAQTGVYVSKPFDIFLAVDGNRLMIIMAIGKADGSKQPIKALFSRKPIKFLNDKT